MFHINLFIPGDIYLVVTYKFPVHLLKLDSNMNFNG